MTGRNETVRDCPCRCLNRRQVKVDNSHFAKQNVIVISSLVFHLFEKCDSPIFATQQSYTFKFPVRGLKSKFERLGSFMLPSRSKGPVRHQPCKVTTAINYHSQWEDETIVGRN
jgi:hypothetical protein